MNVIHENIKYTGRITSPFGDIYFTNCEEAKTVAEFLAVTYKCKIYVTTIHGDAFVYEDGTILKAPDILSGKG